MMADSFTASPVFRVVHEDGEVEVCSSPTEAIQQATPDSKVESYDGTWTEWNPSQRLQHSLDDLKNPVVNQ